MLPFHLGRWAGLWGVLLHRWLSRWVLPSRLAGKGHRRRWGFLLLLNLRLLGYWLLTLRVQVQDLVADVLQQLYWYVLYKLLPPPARRLLGRPLLDVKLTESAGEVHDSHCYYLWLPL